MTTDLVAGLREYESARQERAAGGDPCRFQLADIWLMNNASAIADEMERLAADAEKWRKYFTAPVPTIFPPDNPGGEVLMLAVNREEYMLVLRHAIAFRELVSAVDSMIANPVSVDTLANALLDKVKENARLRAEVERLSTPDMWWDSAAPEVPVRDPRDYYVFGDLKDGDCITFMAAKRLPNETYKLVDNPKVDGDYDIVLVPDAKGGG